MFSFVVNAAKYVLGQSDNTEPSLDELIAKFEDSYEDEQDKQQIEEESLEDQSPEGWFYATGTVTSISEFTIVLDDTHSYNIGNTPAAFFNVGAKVQFMAHQAIKNSEPRIRKVIEVFNSRWDDQLEYDSSETRSKMQTINKSIVAKVMSRKGRDVVLEPGNIKASLDKVSSTFIPYVGDWLKLECIVELDENSGDLGGEILEVEQIQPLRSKLKIGRIEKYNNSNGVGSVEHDTVFSKIACQPGYIPCVGDQVVCDSIESDQGIYTWRCLTVVPLVQSTDVMKTTQSPEDLTELLQDKNGITITDNLAFALEAGKVQQLKVLITNSGVETQYLYKAIFKTNKSQGQIALISPPIDTLSVLQPGDSTTYTFECAGRLIGTTQELCIFCFRSGTIGRIFKIAVSPRYTSSTNLQGRNYQSHQIARQDQYNQMEYIPGIRPCKPPSFITVRNGVFRIPQSYWDSVLPCINERRSRVESECIIGEQFPFLNDVLTPRNYRERFHALLYLEEISLRVDLQKYDMASASLVHSGEYLVLKVPGLTEKRPSLITGDRAIISFKWDSSAGKIKYEGCIHKVKSSEVYLKFSNQFHSTYNGEDCHITFNTSYSVQARCHNAINLAITNLGPEILFPTSLKHKELQIYPEENEKPANNPRKNVDISPSKSETKYSQLANAQARLNSKKTSPELNLRKSIMENCLLQVKKRKLIWFNKTLNYHQKEAVRNILRGEARPLPYVIFGPPGTGKTITLCETILQILTTIPESRLLVATPSNSSANLIAERLLSSGVLKPGDLVRLIAHHCLTDDSIPEHLLPYCATGDLAAEKSSKSAYSSEQGTKVNCTASVLGRHRITIGTCIALGLLYNMGFPRGHFTHILVDEAGQATEPEIMVPLTFTHNNHGQIILAGDPMQLGPVVNSKLAQHFGLGESFLVRLLNQFPYQRDPEGFENGYNPLLVTKLLINYRSLPEILELPNTLFYDSELKPSVDTETSDEAKLLRLLAPDLPTRVGDPPAIVFHGVNGENCQDVDSPSWYNPAEATQVYLYLLKLYAQGVTEDDIGIITPYKKQVHQIRELLMELDMQMPKVGSVEEFQGQERKVIIVSTVRSSNDFVSEDVRHALGFVASPRRLNVAITRARALLIILGNPYLLSKDSYWRSVLIYCIKKGSYTGCAFSAPQVNDSSELSDNDANDQA